MMSESKDEIESSEALPASQPKPALAVIGALLAIGALFVSRQAAYGFQYEQLPNQFLEEITNQADPTVLSEDPRFKLIFGKKVERATTILGVVALIKSDKFGKAIRITSSKAFPKNIETIELGDLLLQLRDFSSTSQGKPATKKAPEATGQTLDQLLGKKQQSEPAEKANAKASENNSAKRDELKQKALNLGFKLLRQTATLPKDSFANTAYSNMRAFFPSTQ